MKSNLEIEIIEIKSSIIFLNKTLSEFEKKLTNTKYILQCIEDLVLLKYLSTYDFLLAELYIRL